MGLHRVLLTHSIQIKHSVATATVILSQTASCQEMFAPFASSTSETLTKGTALRDI